LQATCEQNRKQRVREIERARRIVDEETERFLHDIYHKATGPIISQLRAGWRKVCQDELDQLFAKYNRLDADERQGIERTVERIVNKLLHPPLEALRDEARKGTPHGLLDALKRLFIAGQ
jgi:glutamyl-tRNA reductase